MYRVCVWSLGLACLWGGMALSAPPGKPARPAAAPPAEPSPAPLEAAQPPPKEDPAAVALRHFNVGRELVDNGQLAEGVIELQAARLVPAAAPPETDFYLGLAYDGLQKTDQAILAYRRFLQRSPESLNARNVRERLALLERRRGADAPPLAEPAPEPKTRPSHKGPFPPLRSDVPKGPAPAKPAPKG